MIYDSPIFGDARGKLGTMVFSRNASGPYVRPFKVPANPQSALQTANRVLWTQLSTYWNLITEEQRQGWILWAATQRSINSLGKPSRLSGITAFIRANMLRFPVYSVLIIDAPTVVEPPPPIQFASMVDTPNPDFEGVGDVTLTLSATSAPLGSCTRYYVRPLTSVGTNFFARNLFACAVNGNQTESGDTVFMLGALNNYPPTNPMKYAIGWRNIDLNSGLASPFQYLVQTTS